MFTRKHSWQQKFFVAIVIGQLLIAQPAHAILGGVLGGGGGGGLVGGLLGGVFDIVGSVTGSVFGGALNLAGLTPEQLSENPTLAPASLKPDAPRVQVTFDPPNPKPGQMVTATATATGFKNLNNSEDLYYTWYTRSADDKERDETSGEDWQNMEKYKVRAHRLIAQGNGLLETVGENDGNNDGYKANLGGDDAEGTRNNYCYIKDSLDTVSGEKGGIFYEMYHDVDGAHEFLYFRDATQKYTPCEGALVPACVKNVDIACPITTTEEIPNYTIEGTTEGTQTDQNNDETDTTGTLEGDLTAVNPDGTPFEGATTITETFKICSLAGVPTCSAGATTASCPVGQQPVCFRKDFVDQVFTTSSSSFESCPRVDANDPANFEIGITEVNEETLTVKTDPLARSCARGDEKEEITIEKILAAGGGDDAGFTTTLFCGRRENGGASIEPPSDTDDTEDFCKGISGNDMDQDALERVPHHFPQPRYFDEDDEFYLDVITGDGDFGDAEEAYWRTNPNIRSTAQNGRSDEANVAGLGARSFTWPYQEGDEVGVVVEGTSLLQTTHLDSSHRTMWAFVNGGCDLSEHKTGTAVSSEEFNITLSTIEMDRERWNECLFENFIAPVGGGQPQKLSISLEHTPENPNTGNAERGQLGSLISVTSSIDNASRDTNQIDYTWCVEGIGSLEESTERDESDFRLLDENRTCAEYDNLLGTLLEPTSTPNGKGRSKLEFRAVDVDAPVLRVRVEATENFKDSSTPGQTQRGAAVTYITLNTSGAVITAYAVDMTDEGTPQIRLVNGEPQEICAEGIDFARCRALKHNVIALSVEGGTGTTTWDIKGDAQPCQNNCGDDPNIQFITFTGRPNQDVIITARKTDTESGDTVKISRRFAMITPTIFFSGAAGKNLGSYIDPITGNRTFDDSSEVFEVPRGEETTLSLRIIPPFITEAAQCQTTTPEFGTIEEKEFTFPVSTVTNVSTSCTHTVDQATLIGLNKSFGIDLLDIQDVYFSKSAQIVPTANQAVANGPGALLATASTNTPSYILFLLRIILTGGLILFIATLLMNIRPGGQQE